MSALWYMVNNIGMATLCADESDAKREAESADRLWPAHAPHRAVQLVEATPAALHADELLEVLKVILVRWDFDPDDDTPPIVARARTAIAKAKGGAA